MLAINKLFLIYLFYKYNLYDIFFINNYFYVFIFYTLF